MLGLQKDGHLYLLSEDRPEDATFLAFESCHGLLNNMVNFSRARLIVPCSPGLRFESTLGSETDPLDDWSDFDLRLLAKLKTLPQHFVVLHGAVLRRNSSEPTSLVAIYLKVGSDGCGCIYCRGGLPAMIGMVEQELAVRASGSRMKGRAGRR